MQGFKRITVDPKIMGGRPCIRGRRVTVGMIVGLLSDGWTVQQLLAAYPVLEEADIAEAVRYARLHRDDRSEWIET